MEITIYLGSFWQEVSDEPSLPRLPTPLANRLPSLTLPSAVLCFVFEFRYTSISLLTTWHGLSDSLDSPESGTGESRVNSFTSYCQGACPAKGIAFFFIARINGSFTCSVFSGISWYSKVIYLGRFPDLGLRIQISYWQRGLGWSSWFNRTSLGA